MLRVPEPDTVIAQRLNGETPFTATDHFAVLLAPDAAVSTEAVEAPAAVMTAPLEVPAPAREAAAAIKTARAPAAESADIDLTSMLGDLDEDEARDAEPVGNASGEPRGRVYGSPERRSPQGRHRFNRRST